ncbi:uncharacterized protein LOC132885264 [Neoarius graeffei]|uniref:uncharacterized protein LOC132885264 n=1 Tax=Neoarius graeffei TaxID=443677 RepID=UPI00298C714C|nr:uncharacterized protein LOC132885264 [Neoarius graeffei]
MTAVKEQAEENIRKSQEKQKEAYSRKVMKFKNLKYSIGDEVLLCNMRKHGRKGGRIEVDFSGPYMMQAISGRLVTLSTSQGATLKNKYNINHIKPYRRSASTDVRDQTGPVPSKVDITKTSDVFPEICPLPSTNQQSERPSVIQFCGKMPAEHTDTDKQVDNTVAEVQEMDHIPPKINRSIQQEVKELWAAKDRGKVEVVVGSYSLYQSSFRTLQGSGWLSDEVIDAYIHHLLQQHKEAIFHLSAVVASALFFNGQFRCLHKMKFPAEDVWLCPVNVTAHWILVVVNMAEKSLTVIDPMGNEDAYNRKILRNWRNFLRNRTSEESKYAWTVKTMNHNNQMDGSSCGVLVLKYTEELLQSGHIYDVQTTAEAVSGHRMSIACSLLKHTRAHTDTHRGGCSET